jgi:hypothetical protein
MNKNSIITNFIIIAAITVAISVLLVSNPYLPQAYGTEKVKFSRDFKGYGERRAVTTHEEAVAILREYFSGKDVTIGEVIEKELFFKTEIRGRDGALIDKIIIDKRTGRIRSIY